MAVYDRCSSSVRTLYFYLFTDEELTTAQQNKLTEEQNIAEGNMKNGKQLRRLFAKPEKSVSLLIS